ncbi:MAG: bifunctional folylpolyglutamate synthase/dihydrofolate synthase [Sphingobacteriales bacterium]|nr:MAG: bifunctional folylpolyglutamate synthase/dihydrofolate synthase [Sphingobacteriales bacterium]
MDYRQTLDYMFSKLPMFTRIGAAAYKKDLTNTLALCEALDNPQHKFKSIHIAGTNGKGSTSHMLAAILQSAGHKVGLYTSPHLLDFRERIRINGKEIPEQNVVDFIAENKIRIEEIEPSFFELTVAMAFDYFANEKVDYAVIETGLGGRLDSTNIITPLLSVITNISYDHQNMLGDTLAEIAGEKAGIIKPDVPVVIGQIHIETKPVFQTKAEAENAAIYFAEENYKLQNQEYKKGELHASFLEAFSGKSIYVETPLAGNYQLKNLATILQSAHILQFQNQSIFSKDDICNGIKNVKTLTGLRGRWDILSDNPLTIADVAHNEAGLKSVFQQINTLSFQSLRIVFGMVRDKDISKALSLLPKSAQYYFCSPDIPRGLPVNELAKAAKNHGLTGKAFYSVELALQNAKNDAKDNDIVLCTGSIFVVAEVLAALK